MARRPEVSGGIPPGPGWWQASDGNWYPPDRRPPSSPVPLPGWWQASDGQWYPPQQSEPVAPPSMGHWWLASDGNWYPPETAPGRQAPPSVSRPSEAQLAEPQPPVTQPPVTQPPGWTPREGDEFVFLKPDHPHTRRRRPPVLATVVVAAAVLVAAGVGVAVAASLSSPSAAHSTPTTTPGTSPSSTTSSIPSVYPSPQPSMRSLVLLGGPVAADGRLLVLDVTRQRRLELSAVSPVSETVVWHRPFSPSAIASGEAFAPAVFGNIVIDFQTYGSASSPFVDVLGVDIATGKVVWIYREPGETADSPVACAGRDTLCLSWQSESTGGLIEVDAADGVLLRIVPDVERQLGGNLYQTTTPAPTLLQIGPNGQRLWQRPASAVFGPADDLPLIGWDIDPIGRLDVGSVAVSSGTDSEYDLGAGTTTGFEISSGRAVWTDAGLYNCSGVLELFSVPVICRFKGRATPGTGGSVSLARVSLQLEGFKALTGKVTWRQADADVAGAYGSGVQPFLGDDTLVVKQGGRFRLLDEATGKTRPVERGTTLWCAKFPVVPVLGPAEAGTERVGMDDFSACNAAGAATRSRPATQPSIVGVVLDGKFFWPSPHGLEAEPVRASAKHH